MYEYLGNTDIYMYDLLNTLSFFALLIYNLSKFKVKASFLSERTKKWHYYCSKRQFIKLYKLLSNITVWVYIEIVIISIFQYLPIIRVNQWFGNLLDTGKNYFGYLFLIPFWLYFIFKFLRINPLSQMDLITPAFPLALSFTKIACFCEGCCNGITSTYGLYNYSTDLIEFPVQLLEFFIAILIFITLVCIKNRVYCGTLYPIYLFLYSSTRFFSEFLKADPNIWGSLKTYHILCILGVLIAIAEYILIIKYSNVLSKE